MPIIQNSDLSEDFLKRLPASQVENIYNALDVCITHEVAGKLLSQLDSVASKTYEFSLALQAPILEMNLRGVRIDLVERLRLIAAYKADAARIEANLLRILYEGIGLPPPFNYRSTAQLKTLFYSILGCRPILKRNPQGRMVPTLNREALEKLQQYYFAEPLCLHILKLRDLDKKLQFLSTELSADNRIRTSFSIAGTKTGRLSSSISDFGVGNNMQNVERRLRRVFIPDEGMKFCNVDLEQADARNVGARLWELFYHSHGPAFAGKFLDACESGDLHTQVTKMVWPNLAWTGDAKADRAVADQIFYRDMSYRDLAKRLGHGTNYRGQPRTMAMHTKVETGIIEDFQRKYFEAFPSILLWHKHIEKQIRDTSSITSLFGRRIYFFGRPTDPKVLNEAVAYDPQSSTADEIDIGLLRVWRQRIAIPLIQVHDSLLFQYPEADEETVVPQILEALHVEITLAGGRKFHVPTEAKVGWNWADTERDGSNPFGLVKWKGRDERKFVPDTFM